MRNIRALSTIWHVMPLSLVAQPRPEMPNPGSRAELRAAAGAGNSFMNQSAALFGIGWLEDPAAPESMVTASNTTGGLANTTVPGDLRNPPTTLGGTTVTVRDSAGVERLAQLDYVSPRQVNYIVPAGTARSAV